MRSSLKFPLVILALAGASLLTSCNGTGEEDDLAQAQSCLDAVPSDRPELADQCLPMVAGYSSARANVLKCSIYMTSGGLIESKIVQAYKALKDGAGANKEATFMAALSLNVPTVTAGYTKAVEGNAFCQASGSPGLIYVGAAIVAGTYLNKVIADTTGSGVDLSNPASVQTAVQNMLADCTGGSPSASCTADLPTLGSTTMALANAYCGSNSANEDVCSTVNSAVDSAGADPAKVGAALFCYLNKQTYDVGTGACL